MAFSRFRLLVVVQIALILATGTLFVWLLAATEFTMSALLVGAAWVLATVTLVRYVESTNRRLSRFLLAIRHADYSQTFSSSELGPSFDELAATMNGVLERLRETRNDREEQVIFLRTLVQHVPVALLAIRGDGQLTLFNNAARRLLGISAPRRLESCQLLGKQFVEAVQAIEAGQHTVLAVRREGEQLQLNLSATVLRQRGYDEKLICIQDISSELEARELDAVQKLMRVLSHEVMNSITPITSLAETAARDLSTLEFELGSNETLDDVQAAVETIGKRGSGLTRFVNSYRRLTRIPDPQLTTCPVLPLLERTASLMAKEAIERQVRIEIDVDPQSLEISADPELIEQALINLVRNALDAVAGQNAATVELRASIAASGQAVVAVADNGPGLTVEAERNLFVPFFTTKKDGSGVGMSVVRQIMRLHRGTLGVDSERKVGTVVSLRF